MTYLPLKLNQPVLGNTNYCLFVFLLRIVFLAIHTYFHKKTM